VQDVIHQRKCALWHRAKVAVNDMRRPTFNIPPHSLSTAKKTLVIVTIHFDIMQSHRVPLSIESVC